MVEKKISPKTNDYNLFQLYEMGVKGMEAEGISDTDIHEWLQSLKARSFVLKRGGIDSVLLEAGWDVDRYQKVLEESMDESLLRDTFLKSYQEKFAAAQKNTSG